MTPDAADLPAAHDSDANQPTGDEPATAADDLHESSAAAGAEATALEGETAESTSLLYADSVGQEHESTDPGEPAAETDDGGEVDDSTPLPDRLDPSEFAARFPRTVAVFEAAAARGQHVGGQFSVWTPEGRIDAALGQIAPAGITLEGRAKPETPLAANDVLCWRSAGKPVTAILLLHTLRDLKKPLTTPVADVLPEFGQNGKAAVTFEHLLTHTSGLAAPVSGWPTMPAGRIWDRVCAAPLHEGVAPGERAAYDPVAGWMALGQACEELARLPIERQVDLLFEECGAEAFLARGSREAIQHLLPTASFDDRVFLPAGVYGFLRPQFDTTRTPPRSLNLDGVAACTNPSPGSSLHATASAVAWFYWHLLRALAFDDSDHFDGEVVRDMTARHRVDRFDESFRHRVDWGLGVIVNSERYGVTVPYGFGPYASDETFGHGGAQCAMGLADPKRSLAIAWCLNGLCGEPRHNKRNRELTAALYEDLGFTDG